MVRLKQTLNYKGWELSCPLNCIGSLPESLTQGLLRGKLVVGGLGVIVAEPNTHNTNTNSNHNTNDTNTDNNNHNNSNDNNTTTNKNNTNNDRVFRLATLPRRWAMGGVPSNMLEAYIHINIVCKHININMIPKRMCTHTTYT